MAVREILEILTKHVEYWEYHFARRNEGYARNCSYGYRNCVSLGASTYGILATPETAIKRLLQDRP